LVDVVDSVSVNGVSIRVAHVNVVILLLVVLVRSQDVDDWSGSIGVLVNVVDSVARYVIIIGV